MTVPVLVGVHVYVAVVSLAEHPVAVPVSVQTYV
jgi:hypothetical protein